MLVVLHVSVVSGALASDAAAGSEERRESTMSQFGLGTASFFLTMPYGLIKVVYASLGGLIGGFTYALTGGNLNAANAVWDTSLRGTYVITPEHLKGAKAVRFLGTPPLRTAEPAASPEPSR
jgi:hypothetical protein